jgi:hypothetical protein
VKNLVHIYIYDVKFLALLGAPYIYDISRLRVKLKIPLNYPDHGHYWNPPLQGKIPIVELEIEPGTS